MEKRFKHLIAIFGLILGVGVLSSCTASFCSNEDVSRMMYAFDKGITRYFDADDKPESAVEMSKYPGVYKNVNISYDPFLSTVLDNAISSNYFVPNIEYFQLFDDYALDFALTEAKVTGTITAETINTTLFGINGDSSNPGYGYTRYLSTDKADNYGNYDKINQKITDDVKSGAVTGVSVPGTDFTALYKKVLTSKVSTYRNCITTIDGDFGNYGLDGESIFIATKSWSYAWSKGFLEGLLIYPIAFMADFFAISFAGGTTAGLAAGWPQLLSICLVTIIVRLVMMLFTLKSTLSQGKMQDLQPQLAKLQQKYPNSNTNQYEKQRLAQEQMALYKKNHISPFSQIIVMIIQFPVFICVWGALSGSAALSSGAFLNLNLSSTVQTALFNISELPGNGTGWWTALCLFLIMAVAQFLATKLPTWLNKAKMDKVKKTGVNPAANQSQKTMKIVQWVMLAMIIIMGFTLPAAMGVYWIIGAIFSMGQSVLVYLINNRKKKGRSK